MNKPRESALLDAVPANAPMPGVGMPHPHESAHLHVAGEATYVDDMPELADTCVVLNGVAKTYAMTGWRVGWMIAPTDVVTAASNLQSHATSNVANVSQIAALAAVTGDLTAVAAMRAAFDVRRQTMVRMLNEVPGFACPTPEGAFYCFPSVTGALGRELRGRRPQTSAELAALILDEAEVAVVPGEAFGAPGYFRLSYALGDADLVEGVERVQRLLAEASD
jgi:aspartate/methionine/tyrosine aminotransferase